MSLPSRLSYLEALVSAPLSSTTLNELYKLLEELAQTGLPGKTVREIKNELQTRYDELTRAYLKTQQALSAVMNAEGGVDVVVVDDDQDLNDLVCLHLRREGFVTLSANSGAPGVRLIQQHRPRVVLMDIDMPGMDGIEALRYLKTRPETQDIPVIMFSATASTARIQESRQAGAYVFVPKCLEQAALAVIVDYIRTAMGVRSPGPG